MTKSEPKNSALTQPDPWQDLKQYTRARIALGRVGSSLPTKEVLDLGLAHAMARDAVHLALHVKKLEVEISALGFETAAVQSRAPDRASYLLRPDWGRRLSPAALEDLANASFAQARSLEMVIVVADGLSALAVSKHAVPLLQALKATMPANIDLPPVVIASQSRVAIADEIAETLNAKMAIMVIGERPGLSSPDSLGIYMTYAPKVGFSDADRNCISNIRPEGLHYQAAANKLMWLVQEAMRLKLSGVGLKDESDIQQVVSNANVKMLKDGSH